MRVLTITSELPTPTRPGSMAPVLRQIQSLRCVGASVKVLEIKGSSKFKYLEALPRVWALARSVDIIHAHYGFCGWIGRAQVNKPVVVSFMGDDLLGTPDADGRKTRLSYLIVTADRWLARGVDAVIVKSEEMAAIVAPVKAHVIPNGIDLQAFRPMDTRKARAALGWPERKRYVLFPSSPDIPRKGFALARDVVNRASIRVNEPLELISLWGVALDKVPLYMNASEAMLLTSFWEGSPNVVKEAMACDLPVVSVPVGDIPELLSGLDGCAICPRESEPLAQALAAVLSRHHRTEGRCALKRKGLDLDSVARKVLNVYEEVLRKSRYVRHCRNH
jgi:glycosyltransferase involved in cell wall biosynthesis